MDLAIWSGLAAIYKWKKGLTPVPQPTTTERISTVKEVHYLTIYTSAPVDVYISSVNMGRAPIKIPIGDGLLPKMIRPGHYVLTTPRSGNYDRTDLEIDVPVNQDTVIDMKIRQYVRPTEAEKAARAAAAGKFRVYITSSPSGASVLIDGQEIGRTTPCYLNVGTGRTEISPGIHRIEARKNGYTGEVQVSVSSTQHTNVSIDLTYFQYAPPAIPEVRYEVPSPIPQPPAPPAMPARQVEYPPYIFPVLTPPAAPMPALPVIPAVTYTPPQPPTPPLVTPIPEIPRPVVSRDQVLMEVVDDQLARNTLPRFAFEPMAIPSAKYWQLVDNIRSYGASISRQYGNQYTFTRDEVDQALKMRNFTIQTQTLRG
jgi:hypothetical protein